MASGPVIRNMLKRSGIAGASRYWKFFKEKCDLAFGTGWRVSREGVLVGTDLVIPVDRVGAFLENDDVQAILPAIYGAPSAAVPSPIAPVLTGLAPAPVFGPEPVLPVEPVEPTFECKKKGCGYVGYTKKALEAHCRRTGH